MGPWGPKMGVPPKSPYFKEDAFPSFVLLLVTSVVSPPLITTPRPHDDVVVVV